MKKIISILIIIVFLCTSTVIASPPKADEAIPSRGGFALSTLAVRAAAHHILLEIRLAELSAEFERASSLARKMREIDNAIEEIWGAINTAYNSPEAEDNITAFEFMGKIGEIEQFVAEYSHQYDSDTIEAVSSVLRLVKNLVSDWMQDNKFAHAELHPVVSDIKNVLGHLVYHKLLFESMGNSLEELGFKEVRPGSGIYLSPGEFFLILTEPGDASQIIKAVGLPSTGDFFEPSVFEEEQLRETEPSSGIFLSESVEGYQGCVVGSESETRRYIVTLSRNEGGFGFINDGDPMAVGLKLFYGSSRNLLAGAILMEDEYGEFVRAFPGNVANQTKTRVKTEAPIEPEIGEPAVNPEELEASGEINGIPISEIAKKLIEEKRWLSNIPDDVAFRLETGQQTVADETAVAQFFVNNLRSDNRQVTEGLGRTHQELAQPLYYLFNLMDRYATDCIDELDYNGMRFQVTRDLMISSEISIFGDDLNMSTYRVKVVNLENGDSIEYWGMAGHYISHYGFYPAFSDDGYNPRTRLEPADINRVFFAPDKDDPILRAKNGEEITISSLADMEKLNNISQEDQQMILPRLHFLITEREMLEGYSKLLKKYPEATTEILQNSTFQFANASVSFDYVRDVELREAFLSIWKAAPEAVKDNMAMALETIDIHLSPEYLKGLVSFLRQTGFDNRITAKVESEDWEEAQEFVNALVAHTDYGYHQPSIYSSEHENALIANLIVQILNQFDDELASVKAASIKENQRERVVNIVKNGFEEIFNFLSPLHITANLEWKSQSTPDDIFVAGYYTLTGEEPIKALQKARPVYLTGFGFTGAPRVLFGIAFNYCYALDEEGNLEIVKVRNVDASPRPEPMRHDLRAATGA